MLSKKTKKSMALSMALTMAGGFVQNSALLTAAYGEETSGQEAVETLEDAFIKANKSLTEKLDSELNNESTQEDVQTILNDFEYVTSGAAVRITAKDITDYKNDAEGYSFKASLEGYEKNGESYELNDIKEFTYSKPKETSILTTMAYSSSPVGSGEWVSSDSLTSVDQEVTITKGNQIVKFKLLNAANKTVSVSGNGMKDNDSIADGSVELEIPETITCNGTVYTVTEISNSAFYYCRKLGKVTIPDSVRSIEDKAFRLCIKITSITLGEGLTSIGESAFVSCGIKIIILPESLETIGEYAFSNCEGIEGITFPESLNTIGERAFMSCKGIKSIIIPEGVTSIGSEAFYACSNLKYIKLPDGLDSSSKWSIPTIPTMILISKDCNLDIKDYMEKGPYDDGFDGKLEYQYKILGLNLGSGSKEINSYKGNISYADVLQKDESTTSASVKVEIISGNEDNIAEATCTDNKVIISATGKGNGTVKVKVIAEETVNGENYEFYKIREVEISNNTDRNSLIDKYNEASNLSQDNYTEVSFSALKEAINNAGIVMNDSSTASEEDIENAYNALNNAIDNLVDISEIKKLYADVKDIAKGNYTDKTYNKFKTALKGAETIINKKDASKSEVDNALTELKEATEQLLGTDKTSLISLYNKYVAMKQGEYTDDSFNNFTVALSDAKSVIENGNATQSEITAAENKLQDAVSVLKVKNSSSGGSSSGSGSSGGSSSSSSSSGSSSSGSSSGSSSASEAKPVITVDGQEIKPVTLSKDTYGSSVIGNTLAPLGLNLSELNLLYEINSDKFKGNVAKLSKTIQNADGTKSETHYVYIKCEEGEKFKADVSNLNKDVPAYVYKIDNKGSVSLIQTLDSNTVKNNGYAVELNSEIGSTYVISEEKIDTASNTSAPSVTTGWNLIDGKWHEVLADGNYVKGWHKDTDGKWYMLDITTGVMVTGWFKDKDEKWYYLKESGAMATGWVKDIDGKWYYLYADGSMAADTTVDGYYLGKSGAWSN